MTFSLPLNPKANANVDTLAQLPRTSGVYIFKGTGTLPLYIGKSVDIRSRVMAHMRAEDEVEMMSQTMHVECIETAGEIGALLLESHLIKSLNPIFNVRLRRLRSLCTLKIVKQGDGLMPAIVNGKDLGLGKVDGLYGLFGSVHAAQSKLREMADQHRLCLGLLGLEKIDKRGCFGLQVKTCLGACVGHEQRPDHDERLLNALTDMKVHAWPFEGAIELVEQSADWIQRHRIQDWRYLGTTCSRSSALKVSIQQSFDLDTYKILVKPIMLGSARIEAIEQA